MAHVKSSSIFLIITSFLPVLSTKDLKEKARPGGDVTLICQAPDGVDITVVEWRRTDSEDLHVFLYRDGHVDSFKQHPSFKNRVELKDKEMKNGDLSVILKNVKKEDSGTYECRFKVTEAKRRKRAIIKTKPISTIQLEVVDPDPGLTEEHNEDPAEEPAGRQLYIIVAVVGALAVIVVVVVCVKQPRHDDRPQSESDEIEMEPISINQES
ncbi:programmed cell death 1 ligand 1-like isoform X1 [Myripristis murdjan]|uniref:programmed cell death 1 ligand 1-like isoform X1 n=1 Tax=Myripristis murdjan TaxID=586833 RepID=UPI0011760480|nr:programmed cell death 1 ligand 1-like isoform X1 [Myripristis murdjan]